MEEAIPSIKTIIQQTNYGDSIINYYILNYTHQRPINTWETPSIMAPTRLYFTTNSN